MSDVDALVELGARFHAESPYHDIPYEPVALAGHLLNAMSSPLFGIFVAEEGDEIIGAACVAAVKVYFTSNCYFATEMFWFVDQDYRKGRVGFRLLHAMERWADERNCKLMSVISFDGRKPRRYKPLESTYAMRLN